MPPPTVPSAAMGRPVQELTDDELEQQGKAAHDTRNWVFLNGTSEQFATHTSRMLELEQEYLQRHPKRTWQGSGGAGDPGSDIDVLKAALRGIVAQINALLEHEPEAEHGTAPATAADDPVDVLLSKVASAPGGRMHKLELHQAAREAGLERSALASLYKAESQLLSTEQADRVITAAGLQRLADHKENST